MIRITYARDQQPLAERIRDDLSAAEQLAQPWLIVLVSLQSRRESTVQAEIERAIAEHRPILPILVDEAELPAALAQWPSLDFRQGYMRESLLSCLEQDRAEGHAIRRANRRALAAFGILAALIFALAIVAMANGAVAFPVAEYNEEATFQAGWIDGYIRETLEYAQPRTTADALNFAATFEAAPTRLYFYVRGTATALANPQEA